jgi:hypothetical protein
MAPGRTAGQDGSNSDGSDGSELDDLGDDSTPTVTISTTIILPELGGAEGDAQKIWAKAIASKWWRGSQTYKTKSGLIKIERNFSCPGGFIVQKHWLDEQRYLPAYNAFSHTFEDPTDIGVGKKAIALPVLSGTDTTVVSLHNLLLLRKHMEDGKADSNARRIASAVLYGNDSADGSRGHTVFRKRE